jgi:uncharacterized membrane protein YozB (DUF420 family)
MSGPLAIVLLKGAVGAVTLILLASLWALATGRKRLHGRLNWVFFVLSVTAVLGLEALIRVVDPTLFDYFGPQTRFVMAIHLSFSIPATLVLPLMLYTGATHRRRVHVPLSILFSVLWLGTFVTGIFFLPTSAEAP